MAKISDLEKLIFYRELRDSNIRTKDIEVRQTEQRIRFFISFVTAIIAFIGILDKVNQNSIDPFILTLIVLPILIVYGILTFSQIIWSSHVIHNLDVAIGRLNDLLRELDPNLKKGISQLDLRDDSKISVLRNVKGTFAQYMYLTEGLLVAGFILLLGLKCNTISLYKICFIALGSFINTGILMFVWSNHIKKGTKMDINKIFRGSA
jgi:hypothetical protein